MKYIWQQVQHNISGILHFCFGGIRNCCQNIIVFFLGFLFLLFFYPFPIFSLLLYIYFYCITCTSPATIDACFFVAFWDFLLLIPVLSVLFWNKIIFFNYIPPYIIKFSVCFLFDYIRGTVRLNLEKIETKEL